MNEKSKKLVLNIIGVWLVFAIGIAMFFLVYTDGPQVITTKVKNLTLTQKEFEIDTTWDALECGGYKVTVTCEGKTTGVKTQENRYVIDNVVPGKRYKVKVQALLANNKYSRGTTETLTAERIKQNLKVYVDNQEGVEKYDGFKGDKFKITAEGIGNIDITTDDGKHAKVIKGKTVKLKNPGQAIIKVSCSGDALNDSATKEVVVNVYPDELEGAAKIKAENVSATRAKLSWSAVPLAQTYVVMKQNAATGKYQEVQTVEEGATETEITRDIGKYAVKAKAVVKGKEITGKRSEHVNVEGTFENAKAYRSSKIIMRLNSSTVDLVREIHGDGNARVPQSLSKKDDCYVVSYVSSGGSSGKFISYRRDGELAAINNASGMGYANGTTYNPNTNKFYVVKTHKSIRTASCSTYNGDTKEFAGSFSLPKVTSGIAYDESNNKYYLSKGNELYVCDNQFKVEKFIHKFIRYNHAQDIGAYNGVIFVCTWVSGNTSYIDLYRISDGAYLGTIDACIGEVESVVVDDGYLVILMNRLGTSDDYIYKTKERFTLE